MGEIGVPNKYVTFSRHEPLYAAWAVGCEFPKMRCPLLMHIETINGAIPMFTALAKMPIGKAVAARSIYEFTRTFPNVFQRNPARGQFRRAVHHDIGRILMQSLLGTLIETKALEE
jgi:hypothetical protein